MCDTSACGRIPEHPGYPDYPTGVWGDKNPSWHSRAVAVGPAMLWECRIRAGVVAVVLMELHTWVAVFVCPGSAHWNSLKSISAIRGLEKLKNPPFTALSCILTAQGAAWIAPKWHLLGADVSWTLAMLLLKDSCLEWPTGAHPHPSSLLWHFILVYLQGGVVWFLGGAFISTPRFSMQGDALMVLVWFFKLFVFSGECGHICLTQ